jgi:hypothetical protein
MLAYPQERVSDLLHRCITGAKPYRTEIAEARITPEEKALLYFVLPI